MHIRQDEAFALLSNWRDRETQLKINVTRSGVRQELRGCMIGSLEGAVVEVIGVGAELKLDVQGADFNGGDSHRPYLTCEFRNGDRYSFTKEASR